MIRQKHQDEFRKYWFYAGGGEQNKQTATQSSNVLITITVGEVLIFSRIYCIVKGGQIRSSATSGPIFDSRADICLVSDDVDPSPSSYWRVWRAGGRPLPPELPGGGMHFLCRPDVFFSWTGTPAGTAIISGAGVVPPLAAVAYPLPPPFIPT